MAYTEFLREGGLIFVQIGGKGLKWLTKNWPGFKWRITLSLFGSLFHLFTVGLVLILTSGKGEGQAFLLLVLDFPLTLLMVRIPELENYLTEHILYYMLYFLFLGTVMYAFGGWIIGYFCDRALWASKK